MTDEESPANGDESVPELDESEPGRYSDDEESTISGSADGGTTQTLVNLLSRHPFSSLYQATGGNPSQLDTRGWICFVLDVVFVLAVVTVLIGVIVLVAWKTLAPLPAFWTH